MKFRKSIIVTSLASVMAVSMVGAITGTVAWYQYSTRATVSMIGMNVAETGILEISKNHEDWQRDLTSSDLVLEGSRAAGDFSITPITWGVAADQDVDSALPANAYKNPDVVNKAVDSTGADYATRGKFATAWDAASAENDYIQYKVYLRAREVDNVSGGFTQTAEKVYLTDAVLADLGSGTIASGLRVHLAIDANGDGDTADAGDSNKLLATSAISDLALHGSLDQDNDGVADRVGGYEWAQHRDDVIDYGAGDYVQNATQLSTLIATRDANGVISGQDGKILLTTPTTGYSIITVTIWLEGWDTSVDSKTITEYSFAATSPAPTVGTTAVTSLFEQYKLNGTPVDGNYIQSTGDASGKAEAGVTYYTRTADDTVEVADWSGENTDGAAFQFGLTFDVGRDSFKD